MKKIFLTTLIQVFFYFSFGQTKPILFPVENAPLSSSQLYFRFAYKILSASEKQVVVIDNYESIYSFPPTGAEEAEKIRQGFKVDLKSNVFNFWSHRNANIIYTVNKQPNEKFKALISRYHSDGSLAVEKEFIETNSKIVSYTTSSSINGKFIGIRYAFEYKDKKTKKKEVESKLLVLNEELTEVANFDFPAYFGEKNGKQDKSNKIKLVDYEVLNDGSVMVTSLVQVEMPPTKKSGKKKNIVQKKQYTFYDKLTLLSWVLPEIQLPDKQVQMGDLLFTTNSTGEVLVYGFCGTKDKTEAIFSCKADRENKTLTSPVVSKFTKQNPLHHKLDVSTLKNLKVHDYINVSGQGQWVVFEEQFVSSAYNRQFHPDPEKDPFYNLYRTENLKDIYLRNNVLLVKVDENGSLQLSAAMPKLQTEFIYETEKHLHAAGLSMHVTENNLVLAYLDHPKAKGDVYVSSNKAMKSDSRNADLVIEKFDLATGERISKKVYRPDFDVKSYEIQPLSIYFSGNDAYVIITQMQGTTNFIGKISY